MLTDLRIIMLVNHILVSGIIRDYAYCVDAEEEQVDDTKCDIETKPDVIAKECAGKPCEPR